MNKLRFGTGGTPLTTSERNTAGAIKRIRELGLSHLELEFVQNVYIKPEQAPAIKQVAAENDVSLSVHGSYYVNLAAEEKDKWHASINRVVQAAKVGALCGAVSVTYHSGFIQGRERDAVHEMVKVGTREILQELQSQDVQIKISPELTGKPGQFGDLGELIKLNAELRAEGFTNISLCVDFAHKYARSNGQFNTYEECQQMLSDIAVGLGAEYLQALHIHLSGIEHSPKGEKNHLLYMPTLAEYAELGIVVEGIEEKLKDIPPNRFAPNHFNWQGVLRALHTAGVGGYVVCESPVLELDALLMQQYYQSL